MKYEILSVSCGGPGFKALLDPAISTKMTVCNNTDNTLTPCQAYQSLLQDSDSEVCIYAHDDLTIHDPDWLARVLAEFDSHPDCVVVGLGGALALGHPDLYKKPYALPNMARYGYRSNQTDWQVHGEHEQGSCRVAVVDAFFMAIRRDFLLSCGGWPIKHLTHHCLDLWVCCEAARKDKEVRMVGVSCTHHGGGSSTKPAYREAKWLQGGSLEEDHQQPHRWLYDTYRSTLPLQVKP